MDFSSTMQLCGQPCRWLIENKEWLFSGVGLLTLTVLWRFSGVLKGILGRAVVRIRSLRAQTVVAISPNPSLIARHLVCDIQGDFIQCSFFARDLHEKLAKTLHDLQSFGCNGPTDRAAYAAKEAELLDLHKAAVDFFNARITDAAQIIFTRLQGHFKERHAYKPRCCLKLVIDRSGTKYVYDQARETYSAKIHRYHSEYPIQAHSLFQEIERAGRGIIENNIPQAAYEGRYKNARLDVEKVTKKYWPKWREARDADKLPDLDWMDCWIAEHQDAPEGRLQITDETWCYKSVLVAPITLRGNTLERTFRDEINKKLKSFIPEDEVERYIFGFICIDHVQIDYFQDDFFGEDMNMAYIAADMMSLYLIERLALLDSLDISAALEMRQLGS